MDIPGPAKERLLHILRLLESAEVQEKALEKYAEDGVFTSLELEILSGWPSHTIRKDISWLETEEPAGTNAGYNPKKLISVIRRGLGLEKRRKCCVAGLGRLGSAFLNLEWNGEFELAAGFDSNVNRVDILKSPAPLFPAYKMPEVISRFGIEIGLLCVPAASAQACAEKLAAAGIRGILNFAPVTLVLPSETVVQNVYVLDELRSLAIKIDR